MFNIGRSVVLTLTILCRSASIALSQQDVLVGGYFSNSIGEFTATGTPVGTFVSTGSGGLNTPTGLRFGTDGNLYVASGGDNTIKEYDGKTGAYLGNSLSGLAGPTDFLWDSQGNVYVAEYSGNRVDKYSHAGSLLQSYATGFSQPSGLALAANGDLLVTNYNQGPTANTISRLNVTTGVVSTFASGLNESVLITLGPDNRYYVGSQFGTIYAISADGASISNFASVPGVGGGVAFEGNTLYATSYNNNTVSMFDLSGTSKGSFTMNGAFGITVRPVAGAVPETSTLSIGSLGAVMAGTGCLRRRRK